MPEAQALLTVMQTVDLEDRHRLCFGEWRFGRDCRKLVEKGGEGGGEGIAKKYFLPFRGLDTGFLDCCFDGLGAQLSVR